jgi:CheY-like chemotaxis protein
MLSKFCAGWGYRVLEAKDGPSALANTGPIDLLLTDVVLPGMNGRQLSEAMKVQRQDLKVLFMTGYSRNAIVHQGRLDPGVELIQKPLSQGVLATKIRSILDAGKQPYRRAAPAHAAKFAAIRCCR